MMLAEVREWLTEEERVDFDTLDNWSALNDAPVGFAAFLSLAKARKALVEIEFVYSYAAGGDECHFCGAPRTKRVEHAKHDAGCIFATMPRPK
jgi:hypothetical protein